MPAGHVLELSRTDARRVAVRAQLLTADRPDRPGRDGAPPDRAPDRPDRGRRARAPTWSPGAGWARRTTRADLVAALEEQPAGRAARAGPCPPRTSRSSAPRWPPGPAAASCGTGRSGCATGWRPTTGAARDILERLDSDGPLHLARLPGHLRGAVALARAGPTTRTSTLLLEQMVQRGEVAVAGRHRRERLWDLAERVYPDDPAGAPSRRRSGSATSAGCARSASPGRRSAKVPGGAERRRAGRRAGRGRGRQGHVAGRPGASSTSRSAGARRCSRRSTGCVYDRKRMAELFEFDYQLEMYKPRRPAALGLLGAARPARRPAGRQARRHRRPQGRRAAGRRAARGRAVRRPTWPPTCTSEIEELARWLELELVEP